MVEVSSNSEPAKQPRENRYQLRKWVVLVAVLLAGGVLGYFYADQNAQDKQATLHKQLNDLEKNLAGRAYINGNLSFAIPIPSTWVNKYVATESGQSVSFSFSGNAEMPSVKVFTIYKCKLEAYQKFQGKTEDPTMCPGTIVNANKVNVFTYQAVAEKVSLAGAPGSSAKVLEDFKKQVLPYFQILK